MTTRVNEGARRKRPPSFLASRGFAAQCSRASALPLLNLKEKRDCSQSTLTYAYHYLMMLIKRKISEYWKGITVSVIFETLSQYTEWFRRNSFPKTRNFTENEWLIDFFATQQFRSFWWLTFPWKLHKLLNLISFCNICIYFIYTAMASRI